MDSKNDKKMRILAATERIFAGEGYCFSLRSVTKLAQVNVAAVNYYFGSKLDLTKEWITNIIRAY
jgi:AcrR family transcriptional regulator